MKILLSKRVTSQLLKCAISVITELFNKATEGGCIRRFTFTLIIYVQVAPMNYMQQTSSSCQSYPSHSFKMLKVSCKLQISQNIKCHAVRHLISVKVKI